MENPESNSRHWQQPWGEPKWIDIPAGEFWMGSEKEERPQHKRHPLHKLNLPAFQIAPVPITQAQYCIYVEDTGANVPNNWHGKSPQSGKENHPVVMVTWDHAMEYCRWLSEKTGKQITLPSEAEWEKAARGSEDKREYPWGDEFDPNKCNVRESGIHTTTPVGSYSPGGDSPYGCADMCGNVDEWTRSLHHSYPYDASDGRENVEINGRRVVRGGDNKSISVHARCAHRDGYPQDYGNRGRGFRVVVVAPASLR